jgi:hypothetical protein
VDGESICRYYNIGLEESSLRERSAIEQADKSSQIVASEARQEATKFSVETLHPMTFEARRHFPRRSERVDPALQ